MAKESCCRMFIDCAWGASVTVDMNSIETLADGCCAYMFCKSDVMMPDLVAEDLCDRCYYGMFAQCYGFAANRSSSFSIFNSLYGSILFSFLLFYYCILRLIFGYAVAP